MPDDGEKHTVMKMKRFLPKFGVGVGGPADVYSTPADEKLTPCMLEKRKK